MDDLTRISNGYFTQAKHARWPRVAQNRTNWMAYRGEQDFSHKTDFQSQETTPDLPIAVEQLVGTFERALTDSDEWLDASNPGMGKNLIPPETLKALLLFYLERLYQNGDYPDTQLGISTFVSDSVKRAIMEGEVICKVVPMYKKVRQYIMKTADPTQDGTYPFYELAQKRTMEPVDVEQMRIMLDLVPYVDFLQDPTPLNRYVIHRTRKNLAELVGNPEYDQEAVKRLFSTASAQETEQDRALDHNENVIEVDPYDIELYEFWGDVIDDKTGEVLHRNVFWTIANMREVVRQPTPNPFWDGTRPFIHAPLLRVPGSVTHKALLDHAVPVWRANNELVSLTLDQSMRAAWGIGQVRADIMEAPEEVADGVPQGYTAVLKPNTPTGQQFYERVDNGQAPQLPLEMMNRMSQGVNTALAIPDTKLGQLAPREVKATEVVQAMQASGSLYESFSARYETTILEPIFEKCWKSIIQYGTDFMEDEMAVVLGPRLALQLSGMSVDERWMMLHGARFKVRGLRGVAQKERQFNKLMSFANFLQTNPAILEHFQSLYDMSKLYDDILAASGVDPARYLLDPDVQEAADQAMAGEAAQQLNPELIAAGSGASQPGLMTPAQEQAGMEASFAQAPGNQAAGGMPLA